MGMSMRNLVIKATKFGSSHFLFFIFYFVVFVGESKQVVGLLDIALSMYQPDKIVNYSRRVLSVC